MMMRIPAVVLMVVVSLSSSAALAKDRVELKTGPENQSSSSEQDLLILGPLEPIRLRLNIEIDGQPFRVARRNIFDRLFDQFDVDHDGRLTPEQSRQFTAIFVREPITGSQTAQKPKTAMMRDESVTREELRNQVDLSVPAVVLRQQLSSRGAGVALFPLLDTDGDRRLSRAELDSAEQSLHCRDFNDDQLIIEQELLAGPSLSTTGAADENGVSNGLVILLTPSIDAGAVAEILLSRYDRNRDGVLSLAVPAEILSTDGRIANLDRDKSQSLDRTELRGYLDLPIDAVLPLNLGSGNATAKKRPEVLAHHRLRPKLDGGYRIHFGTTETDFRRNNRDPAQDTTRPRMSDYDADTNKYLDETEFMNVPDRPEFSVIDSDRDGKLTETEFEAYFMNRSRAAAAQLVLEVTDKGSDLFNAMDRNFDKVLTPRELHLASKLLDTEDRDGDGFLGGIEMAFSLSVEVSRGGPRALDTSPFGMRGSSEPQVKAERNGPSWFTKMDRNRDGDVSLSEFVGSRADFMKLDHDNDGLISAAEAASATGEAPQVR